MKTLLLIENVGMENLLDSHKEMKIILYTGLVHELIIQPLKIVNDVLHDINTTERQKFVKENVVNMNHDIHIMQQVEPSP
jgi:hypothetical protein